MMAALLACLSGCTRRVKADFPRPPVTASTPDPVAPEAAPTGETSPVLAEAEPTENGDPPPQVVEPPPEPTPVPVRPAPSKPAPEPPPEPPSTQLAGGGDRNPEWTSKIDRAGDLLGSVAGRPLSESQRSQIMAARGFVAQARRAFDEGDERRALVLVDKGLILVEDVERASRP